MIVRGRARDHSELFEFTVEPFVSGGFRLDIHYSGDCHHNITGAAFGLPCRRHSKWLKRPHAVFCTARLSLGRIKNELQNLRFELWEVPWLRVGSEH